MAEKTQRRYQVHEIKLDLFSTTLNELLNENEHAQSVVGCEPYDGDTVLVVTESKRDLGPAGFRSPKSVAAVLEGHDVAAELQELLDQNQHSSLVTFKRAWSRYVVALTADE